LNNCKLLTDAGGCPGISAKRYDFAGILHFRNGMRIKKTKNIILFVLVLFCSNGCKNDIVDSSQGQATYATAIKDSIQYTILLSKPAYDISDTIRASVFVRNLASTSQTLEIGESQFTWSIGNDSGRILMYGPTLYPLIIEYKKIAPNNILDLSNDGYSIYRKIIDTSGRLVLAGNYSLHAEIYNISSFTIPLSLK
jgi:hypothetical protein